MGKPNKTQILIQQEREKRQAELAQIRAAIAKRQKELSMLVEAELKTIGNIEQLDALVCVKPPDPSKNGAPVKEEVSEQRER